jgi:hypothetical protein
MSCLLEEVYLILMWRELCLDDRVMQDNNWGNRDREKEENNRINRRNYHLEFVCKTLGITTYGMSDITTKQRIEINSNQKLLFILFNGCLTFLLEPHFNRPLGYINKEISN